jgi:hemerythrin-like domain-containing protein
MKSDKSIRVMPIAPLMIEHRLIERMVGLMEKELERIKDGKPVNLDLIDTATDFFRTYADKCHHGKEENILFRDLAKKKLSPEHERILRELMNEHIFGREIVAKLSSANKKHAQGKGDAKDEIGAHLGTLIQLYPSHIEKEDKHFFIPSMKYFSKQERDDMLRECWEFNRSMIHDKYRETVKELENEETQESGRAG